MDLKEQYDKLLKYCYMKTKDRFLAEDIVQETYLNSGKVAPMRIPVKKWHIYILLQETCVWMNSERINRITLTIIRNYWPVIPKNLRA